ncbi:MAG: hypothetical protein H8E44_41265 [Planctomycetes bacterium]|nr:hypothetical protein [Planctomycetota bacterium]
MEHTENILVALEPEELVSIDAVPEDYGVEPTSPKLTEPPPTEDAADPLGASDAEIEAMPVVVYCRSVLDRLEREPDLSADTRQTLVAQALGSLFAEQTLNDFILGEIAQALHEADTEAYEAWTNNRFKRGMILAITTLGISGRFASNIIALFRPQFIRELGIDSGVEMAMMDVALGGLYDYAQATMEVRRVTRSGEPRSVKLAAQHARTMASAQPMLKTFMTTLEKLRNKKQLRNNLNVQAAGDVAIQVNEAGASGSARAKDDDILVAKMPPRYRGRPQVEPDRILEAA